MAPQFTPAPCGCIFLGRPRKTSNAEHKNLNSLACPGTLGPLFALQKAKRRFEVRKAEAQLFGVGGGEAQVRLEALRQVLIGILRLKTTLAAQRCPHEDCPCMP